MNFYRIFFSIILFLIGCKISSTWNQSNQEEKPKEEVFFGGIKETMPLFANCNLETYNASEKKQCSDEALLNYLDEHIKFPKINKEDRKRNRKSLVIVGFIVEKNGKVTHPKVVRGTLNGSERIILKVIKNMPKWTPGTQAGKPVAVQYNLPLSYRFE